MKPVDHALWYIARHCDSELSLDDIARSICVSKYYLLRAFSAATGISIMRYVRGRRLSKAAQSLAGGAQNILSIALESGYGSHEAFTRAFKDHFGLTPEALRAQGHLGSLRLQPVVQPDDASLAALELPRVENVRALLIAGLNQRYGGMEHGGAVPQQWQLFSAAREALPDAGEASFGVCHGLDDEGGMDYLCGAEVAEGTNVPPPFTGVRIPARRYAVFVHQHVSTIRRTWNAIYNGWLPRSGHQIADAPLLEKYCAADVELWIPLADEKERRK